MVSLKPNLGRQPNSALALALSKDRNLASSNSKFSVIVKENSFILLLTSSANLPTVAFPFGSGPKLNAPEKYAWTTFFVPVINIL